MSFRKEVVVVGAGPAGATLSYLLARSGVRVTLLEQQVVLDREFRGPAYQPAAVRIWEEMGILGEILELDIRKFGAFSFFEGKEKRAAIDLETLPPPYNYLVVMQQATLLKRMIALCGQYPNFTYFGGTTVTGLVPGGVKVAIRGKEQTVEGRLVVGCDGRFSAVRRESGIELSVAKQSFDVVWFEIPVFQGAEPELGFYSTPSGILLYLPKEGGLLQVGKVLPKGAFQKLKEEGVERFKEQISFVEPKLAEPLKSWDQCHLLDVKMGVAKEWVKEGLLLIGDAAHIASPMGALGNKMAIEDAALAHPIIMKGLQNSRDLVSKEALLPFVKARLPDIQKTLRLQRIMGDIFLKMPFIRRHLMPYLMQSPMGKSIRKTIALSPHPVSVASNLFREQGRQYHLLRVKKRIPEASKATTFVFDLPPELKETFKGEAGQFVTLRLLKKGRLFKRCYSLSSIPGEDLAITVKRVEGGLISSFLHDEVKVGDRLLVLPPAGEFVACDAPIYTFIAGGSGITPVYSLIRFLLPSAKIRLFYVNSSSDQVIFKEKLTALEKESPDHLFITHHLTGDKGRPTAKELTPFLTEGSLYLCGPPGLISLATEAAKGQKIHKETFASVTGDQEERYLPEGYLPEGEKRAPVMVGEGPSGKPQTATITIGNQTTKIPCHQGESILDAALSAHLPAPFSCQEGICSTCKADLLEGRVEMDRHDSLTEEEIASGKILTCRAKPCTEEVIVHYIQKGTP